MTFPILLTRPKEASQGFAIELSEEFPAKFVISPLVEIALRPITPIAAKTILLTSAHAARWYLRASADTSHQIYAVGNSTAAVLADQGLRIISANGTAKDMLELLLQTPPDPPILYLRGTHVQFNLCAALHAAGHDAHELVVYEQTMTSLTPQAVDVLNGGKPVIVPLFSARTASQFVSEQQSDAHLVIAAISSSVAEIVDDLKGVKVLIAPHPTRDGMKQAMRDAWAHALWLETDGSDD